MFSCSRFRLRLSFLREYRQITNAEAQKYTVSKKKKDFLMTKDLFTQIFGSRDVLCMANCLLRDQKILNFLGCCFSVLCCIIICAYNFSDAVLILPPEVDQRCIETDPQSCLGTLCRHEVGKRCKKGTLKRWIKEAKLKWGKYLKIWLTFKLYRFFFFCLAFWKGDQNRIKKVKIQHGLASVAVCLPASSS